MDKKFEILHNGLLGNVIVSTSSSNCEDETIFQLEKIFDRNKQYTYNKLLNKSVEGIIDFLRRSKPHENLPIIIFYFAKKFDFGDTVESLSDENTNTLQLMRYLSETSNSLKAIFHCYIKDDEGKIRWQKYVLMNNPLLENAAASEKTLSNFYGSPPIYEMVLNDLSKFKQDKNNFYIVFLQPEGKYPN